jgi:hypothetical protein
MNLYLKLKSFFLLGKHVYVPENPRVKGILFTINKDGWGKIVPGGQVAHISNMKKL